MWSYNGSYNVHCVASSACHRTSACRTMPRRRILVCVCVSQAVVADKWRRTAAAQTELKTAALTDQWWNQSSWQLKYSVFSQQTCRILQWLERVWSGRDGKLSASPASLHMCHLRFSYFFTPHPAWSSYNRPIMKCPAICLWLSFAKANLAKETETRSETQRSSILPSVLFFRGVIALHRVIWFSLNDPKETLLKLLYAI